MVQHGNVERVRRSVPQAFLCTVELAAADAARLVPPGADRIETDHVERRRGVRRLRRLPLCLEGAENVRERRRKRMGDVVIPRNRQYRSTEAAQESSRVGELALSSPMAEITAR